MGNLKILTFLAIALSQTLSWILDVDRLEAPLIVINGLRPFEGRLSDCTNRLVGLIRLGVSNSGRKSMSSFCSFSPASSFLDVKNLRLLDGVELLGFFNLTSSTTSSSLSPTGSTTVVKGFDLDERRDMLGSGKCSQQLNGARDENKRTKIYPPTGDAHFSSSTRTSQSGAGPFRPSPSVGLG